MNRWVRCFWGEESVWYYFELGADGFVVRQVELAEPSGRVLAAASLAEWQEAHAADRSGTYEKAYGLTAELAFSEWEGHDPQWLTAEEFEEVWLAARKRIHDES